MIFIVKDEHNEQRDRVNIFAFILTIKLSRRPIDYCETRHEHSHEPTE